MVNEALVDGHFILRKQLLAVIARLSSQFISLLITLLFWSLLNGCHNCSIVLVFLALLASEPLRTKRQMGAFA
jgi:hypothetical protein